MRRTALIAPVALVGLLLSQVLAGAPAQATGGSIVVSSTSVEVESIATPGSWLAPSTVYEGSAARLVLNVVNPNPPVTATITVVLSGLNRTVANVSSSIGSGSQAIVVPLDLSVGAWSSVGVPNLSPRLAVTMDYSVTDPSVAAPVPSSTSAPTTVPTLSSTSEPTTTTSTTPTDQPSSSSEQETPATSQIIVPMAALGLTPEAKASLWNAIAAGPSGARATVVVRSAVPQRGARPSDVSAARERSRAVQEYIRRVSRAIGVDVRVVVLPPTKVNSRTARGQVSTRITWQQTAGRSSVLGAKTRALMPRSLEQTTTDVAIALAPRPTVLVHGLWSSATTWSDYFSVNGFQRSAHPLWEARAVDTMNTGSLLLPYGSVNTVEQNAEAVWTYLENVRSSLNAGQVDIVAHSMGGIVIRRVLHMPAHATAAQNAIRSISLLGTPNGGSPCAETWSVSATAPLLPSTMATFNAANPGYPGVASTLAYSTPDSFTCFSWQPGDSVVPEWSARAQSVSTLIHASGNECGSSPFASNCAIGHTSMTTDAGWFRNYVLAYLALPTPPTESSSTPVDVPPTDTDVVLYSDTVAASTPATHVSITRQVSLAAGEKLIVSVTSTESNFTVTYPGSGASTITTTLAKIASAPVYTAEVSGPLTAADITLAGSTTAGITWSYTKVTP